VSHGYHVVALDRFFFGEDKLADLIESGLVELVRKDIRDVEERDLEGIHAVCDLAALSNDPSGDIDPGLTEAINYKGRVRVAQKAKAAGVARYLLSSSCSVYGAGAHGGGTLAEDSDVGPLTAYARSTLAAEEETLPLAGDGFTVAALRNATVFGLSRRMRFDLVINLMVLTAVQKSQIIVMGGGRQWRPLVHVRDVARAFRLMLTTPAELVDGQVFNVGLENFQILGLAYRVREALPFHISIEIAPDDADQRNYNVSFEKARRVLGFEAEIRVEEGVREIYEALKSGVTDDGPRTSTVKWYRSILEAKRLLETIQLDGRIL
jgi:nucleoside-diphosphate-sugar epimerase